MADGSAIAGGDMSAQAESAKLETDAKKPVNKRRYKIRKYKVDLWATDFNSAEIGIMKRTQNEAKSDQFTKDMEIFGQTVDGGKREALIAYRKELWDKKKDMERRLVIKLFSETLGWRGTMEMMVGRSLQLTRGAGIPVPVFSVNLSRHDQIINLERCARKWPFMPERFTFFLQAKSGPRFYTLQRRMFSFGADFNLLDQQGRRIGHLDQKLINLGGAWKVKLNEAHTSRKLETLLELFCAMLKFNRASRKHIDRVAKQIRAGKITPKLSHQESNLYFNPRHRG